MTRGNFEVLPNSQKKPAAPASFYFFVKVSRKFHSHLNFVFTPVYGRHAKRERRTFVEMKRTMATIDAVFAIVESVRFFEKLPNICPITKTMQVANKILIKMIKPNVIVMFLKFKIWYYSDRISIALFLSILLLKGSFDLGLTPVWLNTC
jgi:hypothetical protein